MKHHIALSIAIVCGVLFVGCTKTERADPPVVATDQISFEEQFLAMLPILDEDHVLHVNYSNDQATGESTPVFHFVPVGHGITAGGNRQIVCKGSGLSFANCCKDWLEEHPGRCLKVWSSGGTYFVDDNC